MRIAVPRDPRGLEAARRPRRATARRCCANVPASSSSSSTRCERTASNESGETSSPTADITPAPTGKTTLGMRSLRATRSAWIGPEPPKAIMLQRR